MIDVQQCFYYIKGNFKRSQQPPESSDVEHNLRGVAKLPLGRFALRSAKALIWQEIVCIYKEFCADVRFRIAHDIPR